MKKKLVALIMAAVMCAGLTACGNSTADTPAPEAGTTQEETAGPAEELVGEAAETLEGRTELIR